jgi:HEAT repeat protein
MKFHEDELLWVDAAMNLGRLGDERAVKPLLKAMQIDNTEIQRLCIEVLEELEDIDQ